MSKSDYTAGRFATPPDDGRGRLVASFADDNGGHWITIGAEDHRGGTPVYVRDGVIVKGPAGLTNRKISDLHAPPEIERPKEPGSNATKAEHKAYKDKLAGVHRAELNQSKEASRKEWGKQARAIGHKPEHLHALAAEMTAHDKAGKEERLSMLQTARKELAARGYSPQALAANIATGRVRDWTKIRGFDSVAEGLAKRFPGQFHGYANTQEDAEETGDAPERLYDLLTEGNPHPMGEEQAYKEAFDELSRHQPERVSKARAARGDSYQGRSSHRKAAAISDDVPFSDDNRGRLVEFYDQDQPRDEAGLWTTGGDLFGGEERPAKASLFDIRPGDVKPDPSPATNPSATYQRCKSVRTIGTCHNPAVGSAVRASFTWPAATASSPRRWAMDTWSKTRRAKSWASSARRRMRPTSLRRTPSGANGLRQGRRR